MKLNIILTEGYCSLDSFKINDIEADINDFGIKEDIGEEAVEEFACSDMQFVRKNPIIEVLSKYRIDEKEYYEICNRLEKELDFGYCALCV